ncbi:MAG: cysteine desulfurase [Clostridiales bacterium]|nr:cysteine desulfurase [Clostridiales bacterium]
MFFDNASTTKIDVDILSASVETNNELFYNPGGLYSSGRKVRGVIDKCREDILNALNFQGKIVFTGSATEANNLALFGSARKNFKVLISMGEHPSVYNSALELKARGYDVDFIKLLPDGTVDIGDFELKMSKSVGLVSIMHVSNETGAINDIAKLVDIAKSVNPNVIFHCDGVQAVGKIEVDLDLLGVDMYTVSAHKIHGMKGVGALLYNSRLQLKPIVFGGGQESGLRSGTENLIAIKSLSEAVVKAVANQKNNYNHVKALRDRFVELLSESVIEYQQFSGDSYSPYIVSFGVKNCRAETILNMLSDRGVMVGNGSACSSSKSGNRILESMGVAKQFIEGNIRVSFSKINTIDEVEKFVSVLLEVVKLYLDKAR